MTDHSKKIGAWGLPSCRSITVSLRTVWRYFKFGPAASISPKLTAIIVALEDSPGDSGASDEELTLLTDSESSMTLLQSMHRRDFPFWLCHHTA